MTPAGIAKLKEHEGLRLKPYTDTVGKLTIGYGRNLTDVGISRDEAAAMFECDVERATFDALISFPWFKGLDETRQDVVVNLIFNMGIGGVRQFKLMISALERKDWQGAAFELFNSRWCHQVGKDRCADLTHALEYGRWA